MKSNLIATAVLGSIALAASALPVMADVVRKDASNNLYVSGLAPGSVYEFSFGNGTPRTRTATANRCGVAKFSPSIAYADATVIGLIAGSPPVTINSLQVRNPGTCRKVNDVYTTVGSGGNAYFRDVIGAIYMEGLTPSSDQVVTYPELSAIRKLTANACGYIKISNTASSPITSTTLFGNAGDDRDQVENIGEVVAPSCKKISETQSVMMIGITDRNMWNNGG